jgi:hypothetical protein
MFLQVIDSCIRKPTQSPACPCSVEATHKFVIPDLFKSNNISVTLRSYPLFDPRDGETVGLRTGSYYPLGIIGTVPRAYDILGPTKEWKGEKIKINN